MPRNVVVPCVLFYDTMDIPYQTCIKPITLLFSHTSLLSSTCQPVRALVVGMNDYKPESGLNKLNNGVPDARAIKKYCETNALRYSMAKTSQCMDEYNALEEKYLDALQKVDIDVIFFAAHAFTFNGASHVVTITDGKPDMRKHVVNVLKLNLRLAN